MSPDSLKDWYVYIEGQQYGPYTFEEINLFLKDGRFDNQSLVWNSSLSDWQPLQQVLANLALKSATAKGNSKLKDPSKKPLLKETPRKVAEQIGGNLQRVVSAQVKGKMAGLASPIQPTPHWNVVVGEVLPKNPLTSLFGLNSQLQGKVLVEKAKSTISSSLKTQHTSADVVNKINKIVEKPKGKAQDFAGKGETEVLAIEWYMSRDGENYGPYGWEDLKQFTISGRLQPSDLLWHSNLTNWIPAGQVKGLF